MSEFQFKRLVDGKVQSSSDIGEILQAEDISKESWLCVCPHDDDIAMGFGLWMMAAIEAGVDMHLLVVTDGRMGYCSPQQKDTIVQLRRGEMYESYEHYGMKRENIHRLELPDGGITCEQGRRLASDGDVAIVKGYSGLQNAFVDCLRKIRPARVITPSPMDYHPDHQIVYNELMISVFHANGTIWPELGGAIEVPVVYEIAIYCDFPGPPNLELRCDDATFERKVEGIGMYRSQTQIAGLMEQMRAGGAYEYMREVEFQFYSTKTYRGLFLDGE